tara:strand:+ start:395 stop:607 length:213 start_codon:yes stop_codon:yes gene_type:complete
LCNPVPVPLNFIVNKTNKKNKKNNKSKFSKNKHYSGTSGININGGNGNGNGNDDDDNNRLPLQSTPAYPG